MSYIFFLTENLVKFSNFCFFGAINLGITIVFDELTASVEDLTVTNAVLLCDM